MREFQSTAVRSNLDALRTLPEFPRVVATLPPELRALVERPPTAGWVAARQFDRITEAALEALGRDAVRAAGNHSLHRGMARVVMPAVRTMLALFGRGPDVIFSRVPQFVGGFERGAQYLFERTGESSGRFTVRADEPLGAGGIVMLEGALLGMFEFTKQTGEVSPHERLDGGREVRIDVRW